MRRHLTAILAVCLLAAIATLSSATYVSELLFLGEGWYDHGANPKDPMGYGAFGASTIDFDLNVRTPGEACHWYLRSDVAVTYTSTTPGGAVSHTIAMDDAGIWADEQLIEWSDLGYAWDPQLGVDLGYHDPSETRWSDPFNLVGDYALDLDGDGDDLTASVRPSTTSDFQYRVAMQQMRSMSWLATMPLGSVATGWSGAFFGGLPLDGLEFGINKVAPFLGMWDRHSYNVAYRGKILLIADAECPVPEPATILLFGAGLVALGSRGLRRHRRVV
jgi:hypothetical protein